ncbi:MAG: PEP-CTERM sorting domain-containing protein [Verrucomicrobia bacterium]|nr:PEP-CTERM sorting domain-containing protein [Verrucomicrobiota bacterium]
MKHVLTAAVLATLASSPSVMAGTNGFYVPTFREEAGSRSAYWESFTVAVGTPGNQANFGNDATSVLTQSDPGAIVVGSGNLYNMPNASEFTISYSAGGPVGNVVLQVRTSGTELDYGSVALNYGAGILTATRTELDRVSFGTPGVPGPQGFNVSSAWQWDLSALGVSSYSIRFKAAEPSLSLDAVTLDTQVVPEPETWALAALGAGALMVSGWRRSRSSR